ncbi:MAG: hypothetical protein PHQ35_10590 [Phycisphaerae bacterium]|nr:hypothetical protein [Phycisphaerae bacterium]
MEQLKILLDKKVGLTILILFNMAEENEEKQEGGSEEETPKVGGDEAGDVGVDNEDPEKQESGEEEEGGGDGADLPF